MENNHCLCIGGSGGHAPNRLGSPHPLRGSDPLREILDPPLLWYVANIFPLTKDSAKPVLMMFRNFYDKKNVSALNKICSGLKINIICVHTSTSGMTWFIALTQEAPQENEKDAKAPTRNPYTSYFQDILISASLSFFSQPLPLPLIKRLFSSFCVCKWKKYARNSAYLCLWPFQLHLGFFQLLD